MREIPIYRVESVGDGFPVPREAKRLPYIFLLVNCSPNRNLTF